MLARAPVRRLVPVRDTTRALSLPWSRLVLQPAAQLRASVSPSALHPCFGTARPPSDLLGVVQEAETPRVTRSPLPPLAVTCPEEGFRVEITCAQDSEACPALPGAQSLGGGQCCG